jgi:hypothetical protein
MISVIIGKNGKDTRKDFAIDWTNCTILKAPTDMTK